MDATTKQRAEMANNINVMAADRERMEIAHGQVWTTSELQEDFEVIQFAAPYVIVRERSTGHKGSLLFQHDPRFYYGFEPVT